RRRGSPRSRSATDRSRRAQVLSSVPLPPSERLTDATAGHLRGVLLQDAVEVGVLRHDVVPAGTERPALLGQRRLLALFELAGHLDEPAPHRDDGDVAGAQVLLAAVEDPLHRLRHGAVLVRYHAPDPAVPRGLLELPVDLVVVLPVQRRPPGVDDVTV